MKGDIFTEEIIFECSYDLGDCKYKNVENKNKCLGCYFAKVLKTTIKDKQRKIYAQGGNPKTFNF